MLFSPAPLDPPPESVPTTLNPSVPHGELSTAPSLNNAPGVIQPTPSTLKGDVATLADYGPVPIPTLPIITRFPTSVAENDSPPASVGAYEKAVLRSRG